MLATPPSPFAQPAGFVDRRRLPDRRNAERRQAASEHQADRRTPSDRRHTVPRRETGVGHLRNALQTLTLLQLSHLDDHERQALRAASARLWLALFEIQRLPETPPNSAS